MTWEENKSTCSFLGQLSMTIGVRSMDIVLLRPPLQQGLWVGQFLSNGMMEAAMAWVVQGHWHQMSQWEGDIGALSFPSWSVVLWTSVVQVILLCFFCFERIPSLSSSNTSTFVLAVGICYYLSRFPHFHSHNWTDSCPPYVPYYMALPSYCSLWSWHASL